MKSCLMVCVVIGGILVILAAIFAPRFFKLYNSGVSYVEDVVPKIASKWDPKELVDRSTPGMKATSRSGDETERLFIMFRKLGALKHLGKPEGTVVSKADTSTG